MSLEVIVLAAGKGTRMRSDLPKVLHAVGGRPMLYHVVRAALDLGPTRIHIVTGHGSDVVRETLTNLLPEAADRFNWVLQAEQRGTGDAVKQAIPAVNTDARCLVLFGDVPLVNPTDLARLGKSERVLSILTATPSSPEGLGRILRDAGGNITAIVEQRDASPAQLEIGEINTGILQCHAGRLAEWLELLRCDNNQGEYYLTDVVGLAAADGEIVHGEVAEDADRLLGINSRKELAIAERGYQNLVASALMTSGVTLRDPARLDVRGDVQFGRDCEVDVNVIFEGQVTIGDGVVIGAGSIIRDCVIGDHCHIHPHSILESATLGSHCSIGPFARLRPESRLGDHVRIGNFVEVKKSQLAEGAKANHLAYVGDSTVGRNTNIGAGVITCNYDGANKHQTLIGDDVFVGSDSQLVAPVKIADGVTIGAGSTITRNVDKPTLVVSRAKQLSIPGWKRPIKKPG